MTGMPQVCTHEECTRKPVARRLCRPHYLAAWRAGTIGKHVKLPPRARKHDYVCPPEHRHASSTTCFISHQCRCDACCEAHNAREARRRKEKAYGRYDSGLVDAQPAREHVMRLSEFGIGYKRVAELAGLNPTIVRLLIWGREEPHRKGEMQRRMKRANSEAILAVTASIENLGARRPVPATGTRRRVQALVARGYSLSAIARMLRMNMSNFWRLTQAETVAADTHRRMVEIYERLWDQAPPAANARERAVATRAEGYAARRGWLPPLAWDDVDTDPEPPAADVDEQTKGERVLEDVEWLLDAGEPAEQILITLHRSAASIAKLAGRYGRRDLARPFDNLKNERTAA